MASMTPKQRPRSSTSYASSSARAGLTSQALRVIPCLSELDRAYEVTRRTATGSVLSLLQLECELQTRMAAGR